MLPQGTELQLYVQFEHDVTSTTIILSAVDVSLAYNWQTATNPGRDHTMDHEGEIVLQVCTAELDRYMVARSGVQQVKCSAGYLLLLVDS